MDAPVQYGKYQLLRRLATGGMAEVYLARAEGPSGFAKTVVIKRMLPHLTEDPLFVEMFLAEARVAAALSHPNIVQVFDLGESGGTYFLAMEYIEGLNARALLRRAQAAHVPMPVALAARIVAQACEGMAYAHAFHDPATQEPLGLVHRDLSPENLLVSSQGQVKVVDFGVAKISGSPRFTRTGTLKGKLGYMPPEQLRAEPIDAQLDVFALGVVLYELLSGARPFEGPSEAAVIRAILDDTPTPLDLRRPEVPAALAQIAARALAKDRAQRFPDCRALLGELEKFLASCGQPSSASELATFAKPYLEAPQSLGAPVRVPVSLPAIIEPTRANNTGVATRTMPAIEGPATQVLAAPHAPPEESARIDELTLTLEGNAEKLLARLLAKYGEHVVTVEPGANDFAVISSAGQRTMLQRAPEAEQRALASVNALGLRFKPVLGRFAISGDAALELLARGASALPSGWKLDARKVRFAFGPPATLRVQVDLRDGQFALELSANAGDAAIPFAPLLDALAANRRWLKLAENFVSLESLARALGPLRELAPLASVISISRAQKNELRVALAALDDVKFSSAAQAALNQAAS